jgi:subtilisin family serine protease
MILKTQDDAGGGLVSNVVNAIMWAADHGAEVINISIDGAGENAAMLSALQYAVSKNVVVVVAAGNQAIEVNATNFYSPVGYAGQVPGVLAVAAFVADTLALANFSNYSTTNVKIAAPGSTTTAGILSTYLNGTYQAFDGTSMASPIVASATATAVGFLKTQNVTYTPAMIESIFGQGSLLDPNLSAQITDGRRLHLPTLMKVLTHSYYFSGTGGFDENP